jgi:hypothetical protein
MVTYEIVLNERATALIVAYAAAIGLLYPVFQAMLQKPWWSPRTKALLTVGGAVVFGLAGYLITTDFDFSDPSKIVLWLIGLYSAIQLGYQALKRPVLDKVELSVNGNYHDYLTKKGLPVEGDHTSMDLSDGDLKPPQNLS